MSICIEELKNEALTQYERALDTINFVEVHQFVDDVFFISGGTIFFSDTYFCDNMCILTRLRKIHPYELSSYYMRDNHSLALRYECASSPISILMFCTDAENALSVVSSGKCSIKPISTQSNEVICNIGNNECPK